MRHWGLHKTAGESFCREYPSAAPLAVASGAELATLAGHTGAVRAVAFSPDGARLATASDAGTAKLWAVSLDLLIEKARTRVSRELTERECQRYLHGPCG